MFLGNQLRFMLSVKKICRSLLRGKKPCMLILGFAIFFITLFLPAGYPGFQGPPAQLYGRQAEPEAVQVEEILRFHVKAHSNSPRDQEIKNYVARKILARFQPEWSSCRNSSELSLLLAESSTVLADAAREILQERDLAYDVRVSLTRDLFPARFYEGKLYPPGEYTALYMVIGEGRGENWWCVLFPPLCFNLLPPLPAEDAGAGLPADGRTADSVVGRVGIRGEREDGKGRQAGDDALQQENSHCKWRFWLWEKFCRKKGFKK